MRTDPVAAAAHHKRADEHWRKVEQFRRMGMARAEASATEAAWQEDDLAYMLETGNALPSEAVSGHEKS
jgi:hypothetical protein